MEAEVSHFKWTQKTIVAFSNIKNNKNLFVMFWKTNELQQLRESNKGTIGTNQI
jgi:hypothetical protein